MQLNTIKEIAASQALWQEKVGEITRFEIQTYKPRTKEYTAFVDLKTSENLGHSFRITNAHPFGQALGRVGVSNAIKDFTEEEKDGSFSFNDIDLFQELINRKIMRIPTNSKIIFDAENNNAKAFMSERYKRLDNAIVLKATTDRHGENICDRHSYINDNRMILSYNDMKKYDLQSGEIIEGNIAHEFRPELWGFGIETINSPIGYSSLTASITMIRFLCTNGAIASKECIDVYKYKHVSEDLMAKLVFAQSELAVKGIQVMTMIKHAMTRPSLISSVENMPKILSRYAIPKRHHEGIIAQYVVEPLGKMEDGINGYGIYNAITRYASNIMPTMPTFSQDDVHDVLEQAYPILTL